MSLTTDLFELEYFRNQEEENKENEVLQKTNTNPLNKYRVREGSLFPPLFQEIAQTIRNLHVREDDIWMISYVRTGSTWCQEIVWLLANNLDFTQSKNLIQALRAPNLEFLVYDIEYVTMTDTSDGLTPLYKRRHLYKTNLDQIPARSMLQKLIFQALYPGAYMDSMPSPRCIKTHLTADLLPKSFESVKPKIIYTIRNPKDVCVSYYFLYKLLTNMENDFETFCDLFMRGALLHGNILNHYLGYWRKRNDPNVLIIRYEEMKADLKSTVKKIATFLEKKIENSDVDAICDYVDFRNMRENKSCNRESLFDVVAGKQDTFKVTGNHFIRKGVVGDHVNYMSPEMIEKFDKWIEDNTKGTGLVF